jgi:tungstate transport system permease protein
VGISMMVGGNIKWHTRTMTTAIALETNKGLFAMGVALGLVLLAIAFAVNLSVSFLRKKV